MENTIPKSIAWRIDKLGYQPPINYWLQQEKVKTQIAEAQNFLAEKKLLRAGSSSHNREWMLLSAAHFLKAFNQ